MIVSRRALLAGPLLLAAAAPPTPVLQARANGLVALDWAGRGAVLLPRGTRMLGPIALDGLSLLGLAVPADAGLSLLALCGLTDARPRLLGLEVLHWRAANGAHLDTRYTEAGDHRRIALRRNAATPRDRLHWWRAAWTDYLAWTPPLLTDAPVRAPPAGSVQAALGGLRRRVQGWLATPREALTASDIAALGLRTSEVRLAVR